MANSQTETASDKTSGPSEETEIWLRANRRALLLALIPVCLIGILGFIGVNPDYGLFVRVPSWIAVAISILLFIGLAIQMLRPRVTYRDDHIQFFLKSGDPIEVPVEVVEAFFFGQGPANLPVQVKGHGETKNLIARLSQQAPEWKQRDTKQALGRWCDGYITIRGTWCEPLNSDVLQKLNRRLTELRKQRSEAGGKP